MQKLNPNAIGPLNNIRVLDLSRLVAGNMLSLQLADFGADVIKIEPPAGDPLRAWKEEGHSLYWKVYGRNKRSVKLNLRQKTDMNALWKLIDTADVFIENYRSGTLEKMGLSPEKLHARNPRLIVVRVTGYGQTGPNANLPGFGSIVEGMSGYAYRTGYADQQPILPPLALADMIAGLYGSSAVSMALFAREKGLTNGQVIDLSLLEPIVSVLGPEAAIYKLTGNVKQRIGSASNTSSPRNVYECNDGKYLTVSGSTQNIAERIFRVIGRADMIDDPRFITNSERVINRDLVDQAIGDWFAKHSSDEVMVAMQAAGATVGPIYSIEDAVADPHFIQRKVYLDVEDPELGAVPMHNIIPKLSETPGEFRLSAPNLGADTEEILNEVGVARVDIDEILRQKL
ncbi:MAG: CoA transferase [Rhizobiales bacterium]|nr:CoA transferase [Hyphomicrobiales bacterium]NRB13876.1 CoA transferase [Hyphomicrobiales bacterium]